MPTAESVKAQLNALLNQANNTTGKTDANLTAAIASLAAGFGQGGVESNEDALIARTLTEYENDRVETIGNYAFYSYSNLVSVSFPNVKIFKGANNFNGCTSLERINFPKLESASGNAFRGCTALESAVFPRLCNVGIAIDRCSSLMLFDAGADVSEDEQYGVFGNFSGCAVLETVILRYKKLVTLSKTTQLSKTPIESGTGYIYVPSDLLDEYKVATNWVVFSDQFRAIEDYPEITGGTA